MKTIKEFFSHPIIQMALVLGTITITLSYFSKRVFDEPLRNWQLGLPAFLATVFQGLAQMRKGAWYIRSWIGMLIVALSAVLVVVFNL